MGRFLAGSIAALLMVAGGLFWWQGEAEQTGRPLVANGGAKAQPPSLPGEGDASARGVAPPSPPEADPRTREQKRFDRNDRDRDGTITRAEMMSTRSAAFRKLDKDGNNLLSFEEWAVRTADRFAGADANRDAKLTPAEFAMTAPKPAARPQACACDGD
jgi:hypothetical protein